MLYTQNGGYTPLMADKDNMAKFTSEDDAKSVAENSSIGSIFGFEIFQIGTGN